MKTRMLMVVFALAATMLPAETYGDLKSALQATLPAQQVFKTKIRLSTDQAKTIDSRWGGDFEAGDEFVWYYTKEGGKVTGCAVEMTEVLSKYTAYHRWIVGFKADGTLSGLVILELTNDHTYNMGKAAFQKQFAGKIPEGLKLASGVDAVTGATESSQLLVESIQRAAYLRQQTTFP